MIPVGVSDSDVGDPLVPANHQRDQPSSRDGGDCFACGGDLAVPQHRDPVAEREDFLELVADEDDRDILRLQPPQHVEERIRLVTGDRSRRLVKQQNLGLKRERLGDLDDLHLRDRERRHLRPRFDAAIELVEHRARLPMHLRVVDHAVPGRQMLEQDVFAHRKARDEVALLMDGADRGGERVAGRAEFHRATIEQQASRVRLVDACHDFDQRRLPRAVLAHQCVDLAGPYMNRDVVKGPDAGEALAYVVDDKIHCPTVPIGLGARSSD